MRVGCQSCTLVKCRGMSELFLHLVCQSDRLPRGDRADSAGGTTYGKQRRRVTQSAYSIVARRARAPLTYQPEVPTSFRRR